MRNKIKQIMNKEEGFTLVELLAVIVILGIIVAIAVPSIGRLIENAGEDADEAEVVLVIDAARLWEIDTDNEIGTDSSSGLTVGQLKTDGFLEERESTLPDSTVVYRDSNDNNQIKVNSD